MSKSRNISRTDADWVGLSIRSWQLGVDMAMVMGLRSARILAGGTIGRREANRMVTEKMVAAAELGAAWTGAAMPDPAVAADRLLDFYGPRVRRNRRRLLRR